MNIYLISRGQFPLACKSGRIRKALADGDTTILHLPELPGGSEAFELAAKHCYGVELEITPSNVAMLRCAASNLEMNLQSDDIVAEGEEELSLESITEAYIENLALLPKIADAVAILNSCQTLLPLADELNITGRCVDAIVSKLACNSAQPHSNWWIEDLSDVNIDFFPRILGAMTRIGLEEEISGEVLMHYAQNSISSRHREQQKVVERLVSFLPRGKNATSTNFLSRLLRTAIALDAPPYCKAELEKRLALQLDLATSQDLLVLSYSCDGESSNFFDLDVVHRVVNNFLHPEWYESDSLSTDRSGTSEDRNLGVPRHRAMVKVSDLLDSYLAEIATDQYLAVSKFIGLAELLPEDGRLIHDGLYRAIDICLKAHPSVSDLERKQLCGLMDCQRLSQDARLHAARNERLPIHVVVQVLYFEQLRMRDVVDGDGPRQQKGTDVEAPRGDNYAAVRLENRELKFRIARMSIRVTDLEREYSQMREVMVRSTSKRFFRFVSHNLTKLQSFLASKMDAVSVILSSYKLPRHLDHNRCQRVLQR